MSINCPLNNHSYDKEGIPKMVGYIEAKPTYYKKVKYRSRLEARWAVFLDSSPDINEWAYEEYKMVLSSTPEFSGDVYVPDFYYIICAPEWEDVKVFLEVKPKKPNEEYIKRLARFSRASMEYIVIGYGSFYQEIQPEMGLVSRNSKRGGILDSKPLINVFANSRMAIEAATQYRFDL